MMLIGFLVIFDLLSSNVDLFSCHFGWNAGDFDWHSREFEWLLVNLICFLFS